MPTIFLSHTSIDKPFVEKLARDFISREAWESEWVKTEIPLFLSSLKYAEFRTDYQSGLSDLAKVFGIRECLRQC